ncbi:MAG: endonuclease/exonuclease/phosphatase family protein, partial [Prevotella sp.]|nr:endonuclease/exonuclease/phosphatase family protein [Prevotella sp.]
MKNFILSIITLFAFGGILSSAQNKKFSVYAVGFYNLENLFDTCHDEGKNDYEFLADGTYKWNKIKYTHKLRNMARVLSEMGTDMLPMSIGCAVIGVSEV